MAEVPEPDAEKALVPPADGYYRLVEGVVSLKTVRDAPSVRLEQLTRHSDDPIAWRIRQPGVSLFWWDSGFRHYAISLDGASTHVERGAGSLTLVPPDLDAVGEFHNEPMCQYRAAFIDLAFLEDRGKFTLDRPLVGFADKALERSITDLAHWRDDATYNLMAEGWALQAVARLRRLMDAQPDVKIAKGGMPASALKRVEEYVRCRLHEPIGLVELAGIVGLSVRHFARAFRVATGKTPARFVHEQRMLRAKQMLVQPGASVTEIALVCGFSHAQHFSTSFRREIGMTPTEFRQVHRS